MSDVPPPPPKGFEPDPLASVRGWGVTITNGFRTPADTERLRRAGYHPADNSLHLDDDAVDLVPGKSGLSMDQLYERAHSLARNWQGAKVLHEGDHVHLQLPGWGGAPGMPSPPKGFEPVTATGAAHDGDTIQLSDGRNGRLFGYDAFELAQTGRSADGSTVPVGKDARDYLLTRISPGLKGFPTGSQSYGRPVVNLSTDPMADPAHDALRVGNGYADMNRLEGTPQFGPYMEAERLARLNHLGGFATDAETPAQFRHAKDGPWDAPTAAKYGEGQAVMWDDPTPFAGLRPEIATSYNEFSRTAKTPEELIQFGKANGFEVPLREAKAFIDARDKGAEVSGGVSYIHPPRPMIDPGDGAFGSFARGVGDPVNALDEVGGLVDAVGLTPGRENVWNSDRRFGDVLWNNIDQNRAILDHDTEAHPYARIGGQLTSGVALPMGAATTPIRLGAVMAAEGGVSGLMGGEGNIADRWPNAAAGTLAGAALGPVLGLAGEHVVAPLVRRATDGLKRAVGRSGEVVDGLAADAAPIAPVAVPEAPTAPQLATRAAMAADRGGSELVGPVEKASDRPPPPPGFTPVDAAPFGVTRTTIEPLSPEEVAKLAEGVQPSDVLPRPASEVRTLDEAQQAQPSRFQQAQSPDEFQALGVRTVTTPTGGKVRIRGPLDVTQSLRLMGGLKDQGGELTHMGVTNAPRRMDFGSNEQFLGKLVNNDSGLTLDDAALHLWEQGYFPDYRDRPTPDDLLQILRNESMGDRTFHPDDLSEIADFHGAQADRGRIDDAEAAGSPLVEERGHSISLDDLVANSPPTSAYEDTPRLTGKIGNINLDRLEKPADVAQLIDHISKRVGGFDPAARGKITHEETQRLAVEMGVKPEQLLTRRLGQALNAEQLYAARALVQRSRETVARLAKKAVGGSDEELATFRKAWLKHAALEEQVSGATAEAGRALSQFRMLARAQDAGGEAVRSYLKGVGGRESVEEAAHAIVDLMKDPAQASRFIRDSVKPRWRDKFNELWINSLLSGPRTHVVNFVGNALTTAMSFPELATTAVIGQVTRSADRALFGEIGARAAGLADSSIDALRAAKSAFKTGEPLDNVAKVEATNHEAIGGRLGTIIRTPTRALTAADEFWKAILSHAELRQIAYRQAVKDAGAPLESKALALRRRVNVDFRDRYAELVRNPTPEMLTQARDSARYYTFQRPLGPVGRGIQQVSNNSVVGKILIPFVRTPINILKFAGERSALGLAMPEVRASLRAGGRQRDEALAKITLGSGLSTAAVVAAMHGRITGSGPSDPHERAALLQSGWQPNSIRIGDQWVSFSRFDPIATILGVSADFAEAGKWATSREADSVAMNLAMGIAKNITNKTWLSGLSDAFDVLSDPDRYGKAYVQKLASAMAVPAIASQTAQATDPYLRDARNLVDAIKARIPGVSESVPVRRNVWGDAVSSGDAIGPDIVSPFYSTAINHDPVSQEIARLRAPVSMPQRNITVRGKRVQLDPQQYDRFVQLAGKPAKQYFEQRMKSPEWRAMSDDQRRDEVKGVFEDFRSVARDEIKGSLSGPTPESSNDNIPPPPPGFAPALAN